MEEQPLNPYPLDWYLDKLQGVEDAGGGQYYAWCPCHDDEGTSHKGLSISMRDGRIVCNCFSCSANIELLTATLEGDVLEDNVVPFRVNLRPQGKVAGHKAWVDKTGIQWNFWASLGVVEHNGGIAFTWEGLDTIKFRHFGKEKVIGWSGEPQPPLWPMPDDHLPNTIWITAGESDCGTARMAGFCAFAYTRGEGTKMEEMPDVLKDLKESGVTRVVVCGDIDARGKEFRTRLASMVADEEMEAAIAKLEVVCKPRMGMKDLNQLWHACGCHRGKFKAMLKECIDNVFEPKDHSLEAFMQREEGEEDWIVENLISPGDKGMIAAAQKTGKTFALLELTRALVTGGQFMGRPEWQVPRPMRVLFLEEEGSERAMRLRWRNLGLTVEERERIKFWHKEEFAFADPESMARLIIETRNHEPDVVIFDPMQNMMPGVDENDATQVNAAIWTPLRSYQHRFPTVSTLISHHANKAASSHGDLSLEALRGSGRNAGEVDWALVMSRNKMEDGFRLKIAVHGRDIEPPHEYGQWIDASVTFAGREEEPFFKFDATADVPKLNPEKVAKVKVRTAVEEGKSTVKEIMEATGLGQRRVAEVCEELMEEGKIYGTRSAGNRPWVYSIDRPQDDGGE